MKETGCRFSLTSLCWWKLVAWSLEWDFFQCFKFCNKIFSYCFFTETFPIGFQKWFDHDWNIFVVFCWNTSRLVDFKSAWTEIWKKCSNLFSFCRHQIFLMISLRGILVCSSVPVVFRHRTFLYRLISFFIAMQLYLLCFLRLLTKICLQVVLNKFHYSRKLSSPFSKFVLTVFWCSTSYTPIVVPWKMLQEIVKKSAPRWPGTCPKCLSGLRRLEETWTFSEAFLSLTWCSKFVLTELKESGYSFRFTSLFWRIQLPRLLKWLFICFLVFSLKFCTFTETFAFRFQNWFDHEGIDFGLSLLVFGVFLLEYASFL